MKRWMLGLLLTILTLLTAIPASAAPSVEMKADVSGGGRVRFGGWVTILVDLTNQGAEVNAELAATQNEGAPWERAAEYVVPLTLPAGGKKRVPLSVPVRNGGQITLNLRSGGTLLQTQKIDVQAMGYDALFAGVLSDDELGIPAMARLGGARPGASQVARLTPATFPASASLLESYDVIAVARFDTAQLSRAQLDALEAWVGRGGTLLLAGGPEWKRTFAAIPPSLVPVSVSGVRQTSIENLEKISGKAARYTAPVSDGKALRGQVLAAAGETPLVVVDRVGTGKVVYLAADPSLEPVTGWAGMADLLDRLVAGPAQDEFRDKNHLDNMMMNALQQLPGLGLPSPWLMGGILGGYMLLVGPLSYWLLKRKDRREWLWVTVPVLSLGFVGAVYGAGYGKQVNLISHLITVTELAPGTGTATMNSYLGVYAPSRDRLDVDLGSTRLVRTLANFSGTENERSTRVVHGEKTTVQLLGLNNYSMKGIAAEQDVAIKGGLEVTGVAVDAAGNLTGRVVNRFDRPVREMQITAGGRWQELGTLEPGQTSEPFVLDLVQVNMNGKQLPGFFRQNSGFDVSNQRRMQVLEGTFGWEQTSSNGTILVTGWTDEPVATPAMQEMGRITAGTNLIYTRAPIPIDPAKGEVPPGVVTGAHSSGPGFGRSPYGYSLSQGVHVFSLILPPIDPAKVASVKLHMNLMGSTRGYSLAIKNQKSGQWVALENNAVQTLKDWQDLVAAGGLMEVQVDVTEHAELSPPTVSVKGVAR